MDNLDDLDNNAKISDSAYSNSCSNSQSRRSHSSKSTHSGSSGSSGYGGKPSTSGSSNKLDQTSKKDKDAKKKKLAQTEMIVVEEPAVAEFMPPAPIPQCDVPKEVIKDVFEIPTPPLALPEKAVENMDYSGTDLTNHKHETPMTTMQTITTVNLESSCQVAIDSAGFSCAISMHDGVVMYTTQNLTSNLGYPKDLWIGRSFIDFVHPKDRNTFASQITNGLAIPKIINYTPNQAPTSGISDCAMVCRIRRYRSLKIGFGIKDKMVAYVPFLLKFSFKDINEDDGTTIYLIIQATPICSVYKTPNECKTDATPFVIRHSATGLLEYIDIESVPYLGYIPQDIHNKDALLLYHPEDLPYLKMIYETIVKEGNVSKSMPYRIMAQNGDYVKLESEWSSFINPWSMKLEFVIGKHYVVEGPAKPDVFMSPPLPDNSTKTTEEDKLKTQLADTHRENILRILKDVLTKPAEKAKQLMSKRCHDLALIMENLLEDQPKPDEELRVEIQEPDLNSYERDSVMLGGISPHHEYNDSKSSTGTPLSYNQLNYNENLQRYFDSHQNYNFDQNNSILAIINSTPKSPSNCLMSPMAQNSAASNDMSSSGSTTALMCNTFSPPAVVGDIHVLRLTESLLSKHNNDMEKELAKYHREARASSKGERSSETRQKKKEHLARCNATFQPTMAGAAYELQQPHGVKRSLMSMDVEVAHKQHITEARQARKRQSSNTDNVPRTATNTADANKWHDGFNQSGTNTIQPSTIGMPQQVPLLPLVPGAFPMYYAPSTEHGVASILQAAQPTASTNTEAPQNKLNDHFITPPIPHQVPQYTNAPMSWMYPQPVYASPYMYPQVSYNLQQPQVMAQQPVFSHTLNPLGLPTNNYTQACQSSLPLIHHPVGHRIWADRKTLKGKVTPTISVVPHDADTDRGSETWPKDTKDDAVSQVTETMPDPSKLKKPDSRKVRRSPQSGQNSDETMDRTDGESSYSSFYSSFFKTESGSAEDSGDPKKTCSDNNKQKQVPAPCVYKYEPIGPKKAPRRNMEPPWLNQVCVTPELIYKYQIPAKPKEEVLRADLEKMKNLEQPALVNEQLEQLYMNLQLDGVVSRLTLEEGITSSSSSGDEACFNAPSAKPVQRRKREYSQLNMIYEEDAPLPPPEEESSQIDVV